MSERVLTSTYGGTGQATNCQTVKQIKYTAGAMRFTRQTPNPWQTASSQRQLMKGAETPRTGGPVKLKHLTGETVVLHSCHLETLPDYYVSKAGMLKHLSLACRYFVAFTIAVQNCPLCLRWRSTQLGLQPCTGESYNSDKGLR